MHFLLFLSPPIKFEKYKGYLLCIFLPCCSTINPLIFYNFLENHGKSILSPFLFTAVQFLPWWAWAPPGDQEVGSGVSAPERLLCLVMFIGISFPIWNYYNWEPISISSRCSLFQEQPANVLYDDDWVHHYLFFLICLKISVINICQLPNEDFVFIKSPHIDTF